MNNLAIRCVRISLSKKYHTSNFMMYKFSDPENWNTKPLMLQKALWVKTMAEVINEIPGGKEYIRLVGNTGTDDKDSIVLKQIRDHPKIKDDGHTDDTFNWTIRQIRFSASAGLGKL